MEFIKTEELLGVMKIKDDRRNLITKLLGEYVRLDVVLKLLEQLGFEEDLPESKKHLDFTILNL